MNYIIHPVDWFSSTVFHIEIDEQVCDNLIEKVMIDKDTWTKGLKNVHAKTTGWNCLGKYKEVDEINLLITQTLLPKIGESQNWKYNNWRTHSAWINFYEKGDFAQLHNHIGNDLSAVLILKPGKGNLLFHNYRNTQGLSRNFEQLADEKINEKKGTLIFFSHDLFHSVSVCELERISIAFNFINEPFQ